MDIQKDTANDELFGTVIFWWNRIKDVEASNYSTIEARIKDDDLRDIIELLIMQEKQWQEFLSVSQEIRISPKPTTY